MKRDCDFVTEKVGRKIWVTGHLNALAPNELIYEMLVRERIIADGTSGVIASFSIGLDGELLIRESDHHPEYYGMYQLKDQILAEFR